MTLTWRFWVDWDGDGVLESDEGGKVYGLDLRRGREHTIRSDGRGFEAPQVGSGSILLVNLDGRYNAWNDASPLWPNVTPGKRFLVEVTDGANTWPVMAGMLKDIRPASGNEEAVRMEMVDGWAYLRERKVSLGVQQNIYADAAIGMVLDDVGWPWGRALDPGVDLRRYWWADQQSALAAIHSLVSAEMGWVSLRGDGTLVFRNRHAVYATAATVTESEIRRGVRVPQPWDVVRNEVTVRVHILEEQDDVEVWRLGQALRLGPGETATVWASFRYQGQEVQALTVLTPVAGSDYTANDAADGTGADRTADVSVTVTGFSRSAKVEVTNGGSTALYITLLRLRANIVWSPNATEARAENTDSQARYGVRRLAIDEPWVQDAEVARDFAGFLAGWLGEPKQYLKVWLRGEPSLQFGVDVGEKVEVSFAGMGISGTYRLVHVRHRWLARMGQLVETEWLLEPQFEFDDSYWRFPTQMGVSSRFGF